MITFMSGYVYDIFGRRFSIFFMLILGGLSLALIPLAAPSHFGWTICILMVNMFTGPLASHPLIQDYVEKDSYGKAQAFSIMGMSLGVIISLSVLF